MGEPSAGSVLPEGWTEASPGGLATNADPVEGGIIDQEIVSRKWFVVFNREDLAVLDGFPSRAEAFAAHAKRLVA